MKDYYYLANSSLRKYLLLVYIMIILVILCYGNLSAQNNRIEYNKNFIFLSGANVPWVNYSNDIGDPNTSPDTSFFRKMFMDLHNTGGNSMRFWLHIDGRTTPEFKGNLVSGPGDGAIKDLKLICDLAYNYDIGLILCLWSFDMQRKTIPTEHLARNKNILTTEEGLKSYIDNALIPMVDSLKEHPGIIAWEIFNEPEGMTEVGNWDITEHVSQINVQKFINRCAGVIHRTDPSAKVTNGAWSLLAATDKDGKSNYYTDSRLISAGGDEKGTLDFYTVHYYDWDNNSPFLKPYSYWEWDKPMVVTEFLPNCRNCGEGSNYENLYLNGYAGALAWSYIDNSKKDILNQIQLLFDKFGANIIPN